MIETGLDIETTGLKQEEGHRIIEVCARVYRDGALVKNFNRRINPHRPIDKKAQEVHGISIDDLRGCPNWEEVAPDLAKLMSISDVVVAHNGRFFDFPFILGEFIRIGVDLDNVPIIFDTMEEAPWATFNGKKPSLREFCMSMGVDYDPSKAHAAEYDVDVMMQAYFRAKEIGRFAP